MSEFWPAGLESADAAADEIALTVLTAQAEGIVATRELADMGITGSPADVSVWLKATPKQQRILSMAWGGLDRHARARLEETKRKGNQMTQHVIEIGKDPHRNRVIVKSATNSGIDQALAKAAAELLPAVLNAHQKRQAIAKELDAQAATWELRADAQTAPSSVLKSYYRGKASAARRLAREAREGKGED
jgi:hypothetical protein